MKMRRAVLVIASILILAAVFVQSAPAPVYSRTLIHTPTSRVEQYLIMPDKNRPFRVPMSHVHHYSDFEFPKQQLVYYNPDGHQQKFSLHEMKKDHPIMKQMMKDLKMSEEAMTDEMMKSSTDSNMEKLKRADGMMEILKEKSTEATKVLTETPEINNEASKVFIGTRENVDKVRKINHETPEAQNEAQNLFIEPRNAINEPQKIFNEEPKTFNEAIIVPDEEENIIDPQVNLDMVKMMLKNVENSEEILQNPEIIEMMRNFMESKQKIDEEVTSTTTLHPLMTHVLIKAPTNVKTTEVLMEMLSNNQISQEKMLRIAELLQNVDQVKIDVDGRMIESTTARTAKVLNLEIVEETKNDSEIQLRLVDETTQENEIMAATTERILQVTDAEMQTQSIMSRVEQQQQAEISSINESNLPQESSTEANVPIDLSTEANLFAESSTISNNPLESSTTSNIHLDFIQMTQMQLLRRMLESMGIIEQNLSMIQRMNEMRNESSTESGNNEEGSGMSTTENPRIEASTELSTESTTAAAENEIAPRFAAQIDDIEALITEQSAIVNDLPQSTESVAFSSRELSSENANELSESENSSEETARADTPQRINTRQGRVNTVFLHNNRFYVVSGEPDFYANFNAYQNPQTPIFSLQELQAVRPLEASTPVQRIEPFRIFAEQRSSASSSSENNNMESTQNDNDRENEALQLRSSSDRSEQDKRNNIENVRSMMEERKMRNMEQRQEQGEQQLAGEVDRDLSEESSVAQAIPNGIAIAGRGGVASSRPTATALTGDRGIAVGSPQATAIADFDDDDRKKIMRLRLRGFRQH